MAEGPRRAIEMTSRLRVRVLDAVRFWRAVAERAQAVEITFLAAAVAYYAFLSLLPVLLLVLSVGSALGGEALATALVGMAGDLLTPTGEGLVRDALENAAGRTGATVVSVMLLVWSMLKVFRGLDVAFLKVYGSEEAASLPDQIRDGVVAVGGVGLGLAAMFGVGAFVSAFSLDPVLDVLGILILPTVLTAVFLPLYYVFPDVELSIGDVLPGTLFAAVGWTVLQAGFQIYAANAGQYQAYGVLGGVLLLVIWFYLAAVVLLLGAVVNVVAAGDPNPPIELAENNAERGGSEAGDRQLQQPPGSQGNTTPMDPEDDHRRHEETDQPREGEQRSDSERRPNRGTSKDSRRDEAKTDRGREDSPRDESGDSLRSDGGSPPEEDIPSWKGGSKSSAGRDVDGDEDPFREGEREYDGVNDRDDNVDDRRDDEGVEPAGAPDITELQREVTRLRSKLDEFERDVESRTVERPKLESELKRYVRRRMRRGHARGWGPYLVLLYGTVLTLGAFYWLDGAYAIGAMIILALSTLGLYVLFVLFGLGLNVADVPFRAIDAYRRRRK